MELPAPCGGSGPQHGWASASDSCCRAAGVLGPYLLVEGDVVQPHAHLPGEEVGAMVTVLQEAPAQRGVWRRVKGVPGPAQAQGGAGHTETLGAGVVVVEEAWQEGQGSPALTPEGPFPPPQLSGPQEAPPTLHGHGHVVKVMVVRLIPRLEVPLGNVIQSIPTCMVSPLSCHPAPGAAECPPYSQAPKLGGFGCDRTV